MSKLLTSLCIILRFFPVLTLVSCGGGGSGFSASGSGSPEARGLFQRLTSVRLDAGMQEPFEGVVDSANGYAYFGTISRPAQILKVRLSDFTLQGRIDLDNGEIDIKSAAIDPANGFAYFGLGTSPGKVIKVRLSDFTRVGTLTLPQGLRGLRSAAINLSQGSLYLGTQSSPGYIVKVRLSDFSATQALELLGDEQDIHALMLNEAAGLLYAATGNATVDNTGAPARLVKIDISNPSQMVRVTGLTMLTDERVLGCGAIDVANNKAYLGTRNNDFAGGTIPEFIIAIDLATFTRIGRIALASGESYVRGAHLDESLDSGYFNLTTTPGKLIRVQLSNFTRQQTLTFASGFTRPRASVIDKANHMLYLGFNSVPIRFAQINLATFALQNSLTAPWGENIVFALRVDGINGNIFAGVGNLPGKIVKLRSSDLARLGELSLNAASEDGVLSSALDVANGIGFFSVRGTNGFNDKIVKVNLSNMNRLADISLASGETAGDMAVDSGAGFLYAGLPSPHQGSGSGIIGKVTKININSFSRVATLSLQGWQEAQPSNALIDVNAGVIFFNSNGTIVKIRLSDFTRLAANYLGKLGAGAIESSGQYIYYPVQPENGPPDPSSIYKVSTTNLSLVDSLTLFPGENNIRQVFYNDLDDTVYAVTSQMPTQVIRADPSNMTRLEKIVLSIGEDWAWASDIDPLGHALFVGLNSSPAQIVKVQISNE